jgi:hypothetical protein
VKISARAERIEPFYVMEVAKAAAQLAREVARSDQPMIFLNIGEPDFTAPPLVQEAAERAIRAGRTQYTDATGLPALRERISGWYTERFGVSVPAAASSSPPAPRPPAAGLPGADRSRRRDPDAGPELSVQPAVRQRRRRPRRADPDTAQERYQLSAAKVEEHWGPRRAACCWPRRPIRPAPRSTRTNCAASTPSCRARAASRCWTRSTWA